ncbi:glycosyltransferase family 39 protein [Alcaligenaceae bacterium]|nr:glycosyltransferase family 39 protein [Alcaligenaceae bacterium]
MPRTNKTAWLLLTAVLLLPLLSMTIVPLYDTSEPRYAEIARIMAQTGDWITPWFSPGVPFWGKPPLSFWAQALSMKAFGYTEFAARFPSWLCLLLSNAIIIAGLRTLQTPRVALLAAIIYSTFALVYVSSGAVLTDPFLALGTTLSLISFAMAVHNHTLVAAGTGSQPAQVSGILKKWSTLWWQYGFFLGLVIGLLSKGPLAVVVSFAPIVVWYAVTRKTATLWAALPWVKGLALTAALSLPWYILAEIKTPGFLDYFIVGEHFRRFLDAGWKGDLYGTAHRRPYGEIWLFWLQASFPWGIALLAGLLGALRNTRLRSATKAVGNDPLFCYWLTSVLFTPLFFTFSANILWTYLLPSLAGLSIIAAIFADQLSQQRVVSRRNFFSVAAIVPTVVLIFSVVVWVKPDLRNSERGLVHYVMQHDTPEAPLLYLSKPPFSAEFYSAGKAHEIKKNELKLASECAAPFYLAIPKKAQMEAAGIIGKPLEQLYANKRYVLVKVAGNPHNCQLQQQAARTVSSR